MTCEEFVPWHHLRYENKHSYFHLLTLGAYSFIEQAPSLTEAQLLGAYLDPGLAEKQSLLLKVSLLSPNGKSYLICTVDCLFVDKRYVSFEFCAENSAWSSIQGQLMRKNNITSEGQPREEYVENNISSSSSAKWQLLNLFQKILRSYYCWCLCPRSETFCKIFNIFIQWENRSFYRVWLLYPNKYKRHWKNLSSMWKTVCLIFNAVVWSNLSLQQNSN